MEHRSTVLLSSEELKAAKAAGLTHLTVSIPVDSFLSNMQSTRAEAFAAIISERNYQDHMWKENNPANPIHPTDPRPLSIGEDLLLIEEIAAQARAVWYKNLRPELPVLDYIRKIAGVAVRCMETHGAPRRKGF